VPCTGTEHCGRYKRQQQKERSGHGFLRGSDHTLSTHDFRLGRREIGRDARHVAVC
jgi:hypothetical protein